MVPGSEGAPGFSFDYEEGPVPSPRHPEALLLDSNSVRLSWRAVEQTRVRFPQMALYTARQIDRTAEDLRYMIRFLAVSLYAEDSTVFTEFLLWLVDFLRARNMPKVAVVAGLESLQLLPELTDAGADSLLREGLDLLA